MIEKELRAASLCHEYFQYRTIETMIANGADMRDILDYCQEKREEINARIDELESEK